MSSLAGDRNSVLRGTWAIAVIAIIIMILRVFAKVKLHHVGVDDATMILALLFALIASIFFTIAVNVYGFSEDPAVQTPSRAANALKNYVVVQVLSVASTCVGRVAFILYLIPILSTRKIYKRSLWVLLALQVIVNVLTIILILSQCRDIRGVWDAEIASSTECMDGSVQLYYGYFQIACNSSTDLILSVFPSIIFWNLRLRLRIKISLVILTSLGLIAMVASIMKATYLNQMTTWDGAVRTVDLTCWTMIECYLVIITASIPCLRSLAISSARQLFASDSGTFRLTSSYKRKASGYRMNTRRSENRMEGNAAQPNAEASGSTQNFFGGGRIPIEEIEMGSKLSENLDESLDVPDRLRAGIAKRVDVTVTWEAGRDSAGGGRSS